MIYKNNKKVQYILINNQTVKKVFKNQNLVFQTNEINNTNFLTFETLSTSGKVDITFDRVNMQNSNLEVLSYSTNNGITWTDIFIKDLIFTQTSVTYTIQYNHKLMFKGVGTQIDGVYFTNKQGQVKIYGNILSLVGNIRNAEVYIRRVFQNLYNADVSELVLDATDLGDGCFAHLFDGARFLNTVPILPAKNLPKNCYLYMFYSCTSIQNAPELPATVVPAGAYYYMFAGCKNLNFLKINVKSYISRSSLASIRGSLEGMMLNTAVSGNLIRNEAASWTKEEFISQTEGTDEWDYSDRALRITPKSDGVCTISWYRQAQFNNGLPYTDYDYSLDDGDTWSRVTLSANQAKTYNIANGESLLLRRLEGYQSAAVRINMNVQYEASGEVRRFAPEESAEGLFRYIADDYAEIQNIVSAENLFVDYGLQMFVNATYLTKPPKLSANLTKAHQYDSMFYGCSSLTTAPKLSALTLTPYCYSQMFYNTSINTVVAKFTTLASNSLDNWINTESGTFYKNPEANFTRSDLNLPSGWTIEDISE